MRESLSTTVARLATDPATARRIGYCIAECFEAEAVAASVFEQPDGRWSLALHFRARPDEASVRALVAAAAGEEEAAAMAFETLAATDWVRKSREGLAPVDAGRFVVHGAHDRARAGTNRIGIEIEAGLAFGTGHHGSTRGCLVALDRIVAAAKPPRRMPATFPHGLGCNRPLCPRERMKAGAHRRRGVKAAAILDIGTGTGVLAIAAAKALRRPVLASDIDARAVAIARANARANGATAYVEVIRADGLCPQRFRRRGRYGLVLANILLEPLQRLATPMAPLVAPNGQIVLSGLLAAQSTAALAAYRARGLVLVRRLQLEGWMTLVLRRPAVRTAAAGMKRRRHRGDPALGT